MKIPKAQNTISALIDSSHEATPVPRPHLGCSVLGHYCDRWLWLSFRWAVIPRHSGRMLRLFRRGQLEEKIVISDLRRIGLDIGNAQKRIDFGCHIGGSVDGIIKYGIPGGGMKHHILEIKTHNKKSFNEIEKKGIEKSKYQYYAQAQLYMYGLNIDRCLHFNICKDDDRIYTERIKLDKKIAEQLLARGKRIVLSNRLPLKISEKKDWYQCKLCDGYEFCHETNMTKEVNCRTCAHSTPLENSTWRCERHNADNIPYEFQMEGCEDHVLRPDLVPWEIQDSSSPIEAVYLVNETPLRNGHPDAFVFASNELISNSEACCKVINGEDQEADNLRFMRNEMEAQITRR